MTYSSPDRRKPGQGREPDPPSTVPWPVLIGVGGVLLMIGSGVMMLGVSANPWQLMGLGFFGVVFAGGFLMLLIAFALGRG